MAKMRVHELAKQLDKTSKEVLSFLAQKNIDVKSHASTLEEDQIVLVKKVFQQPKNKDLGTEKKIIKEDMKETTTQDKAAEKQEETSLQKKKNISQVFHPQNSQNPAYRNSSKGNLNRRPGTPGQRPAGAPGQRPAGMQGQVQRPAGAQVQGQRPAGVQGQGQRPAGAQVQGQRPAGVQGQGQRPAGAQVQGQRPVGVQGQGQRPAGVHGEGQRPAGVQGDGQRPAGVQGQRPAGAQVQGQRPAGVQGQGQRPAGVQGQRPAGVQGQGQRPAGSQVQGQRPAGTQGQRPAGYQGQGQRPAGTQGQRPAGYQGQGQRPAGYQGQGQRPAGYQGQGQRPAGYQGQGQRSAGTQSQGQRPQGQRPAGSYGQKYGQRPSGSSEQGQRYASQGQNSTRQPYRGDGQGSQPRRSDGMNRQGSGNTGYRDGNRESQGNQRYRQSSPSEGGRSPREGGGGYASRDNNTGQRNTRDNNRRYSGANDKDRRNTGKRDDSAKITVGDLANIGTKPGRAASEKKGNSYNDKKNKKPDSKSDYGKRPNQGNNWASQKKPVKGPKKPDPKIVAASIEKEEVIKNIILPDTMTIRELADKMKIQAAAIVKKLFLQGTMVTVNQEIDFDMAEEIALEYNCIAEREVKVDVIGELLKEDQEEEAELMSRPPVVCVMGHVDHGKTSLLDAIRNTHVIDREAGGITQHIGAYVASIDEQKITFLDTPGHEAFTAMRMRGANATDIAILVVAADDGVMPQTIEAINHAKAAGIEIIVAINKIDKPSANIDRVKQELSEYELVPEDWGGSTVFVPVSARTHEGIDQLLEMILLTAEVGELKANPNRLARGLVIEAELDKGKGPVATILIQKGTLNVGDNIAVGSCYGKVRAMMDDKGRRVKQAGPSIPVEVLGLSGVPNAGEIFVATETDKEARSFAETFISEGRERLLDDTKARMSLNDLFTQIKAGNLKELGIIVKADVQGSVEAVKQSLLKLSNDEVVVKIIHGGVGAINESDVILASTSNAIIIGFNVRPDATAKATAEQEHVDLRLYKVIYDAIADVEAAMKGMLDPVFEEKVIGHAQIRQLFKASGIGTIAGAYVLDGIFQRGCTTRITRDGEQIFEGPLASLKRFKDDVKEVRTGYECGLVFEKFNDLMEDDIVEAYIMVEVPR